MSKDVNIEKAIEQLEEKRLALSAHIARIETTITTLKELLDIPAESQEPKDPQHPQQPEEPQQPKEQLPVIIPEQPILRSRSVGSKAKTKKTSTGKITRSKKSKYKGVSPIKLKSGEFRYIVVKWNGKTRKNERLGAYDSELLAAAAYEAHVGNIIEARRLRKQDEKIRNTPVNPADLQEQIENNPDRSIGRKLGTTIYVCKRCGVKYEVKPKQCTHCMCDDFREIPRED